jgi:hypothetical protein
MYLTQDYKDIIELFNKHNVKYLIAGAFAMSKVGYSRSTYDIDLWVEKTIENAIKVYKALDEFGVPFEIVPDDFLQDNSVIQIGIAPSRIDILTDIDGLEFSEAYSNSNVSDFDGLKAYSLCVKDLIKNKSSTKRKKDILDIEQLKALVKSLENKNTEIDMSDFDFEYISTEDKEQASLRDAEKIKDEIASNNSSKIQVKPETIQVDNSADEDEEIAPLAP